MGVVHHSCYINWFEVGRTEWLRCFGVPYDRLEAAGLMLPVMDVRAHYLAPARFDDCFAIFTAVAEFSPVRLKFCYEVRALSEADYKAGPDGPAAAPAGTRLTEGSSTHVFVNDAWKTTRFDRAAPALYRLLQAAV